MPSAQLLLELGFGMALADGEIDRAEMLHLPAIVNAQFHFSEDDRRRITAYCDLRKHHPPKLSTIARRLSRELDSKILDGLGRFLVGVAASNNVIEGSEHLCLQNTYTHFGLSNEHLEAAYTLLNGNSENTSEATTMISDESFNKYLAKNIHVSLEIGDIFKLILKKLSKKPRKKRAKREIPKAGTSTLSIEEEYALDYQFTHYDHDTLAHPQHLKI